jgi:hypothetical protein
MEYLDFGTPISFGYTAQYLPQKSVTRRDWKQSHVSKFIKAFERTTTDGKNLRVPALDKAFHAGGKQIGWLILTEAPYKEALKNMPEVDLIAEGGMCATVKEFTDKYFKGELDKEVWVIRFRFQELSSKSSSDIDPIQEVIEDTWTLWEKEYCAWLKNAKWCIHEGENKRIEAFLPGTKTLRLEGMKEGAKYCAIWEVSECTYDFNGFPLPVICNSPYIQASIDKKSCDPAPETKNSPDIAKNPKSRNLEVLTSSKSDEHFTPISIIQAAHEVSGTIDLDPMSCCTANKTVRAAKFYDKKADGLKHPWSGKIWLNPAFSLANEAVAKLLYHYLMGDVTEALLLLKATPDTSRHQSLAAFPMCEWRGRVKFTNPENKKSNGAPFPILIFYLGKNFERFREVFSPLGNIRLGQNQVTQLEKDRRELLAQVAELQMQLAKKSELGSNREPDQVDWLKRDLNEQMGIAESRLQELQLDREVLPEDLFTRQRVEWQARLDCLRYTQEAIAKIAARFTEEYEQLLNREHPQIETEENYTPDFAPKKWVESSPETGNLLVRIEHYRHTSIGWIAECNVRRSDRIDRNSTFLIKGTELFGDFHPWGDTKKEREVRQPLYSLGSIRTGKGLKSHFRDLKLPDAARPELSEVRAPDGSIWQACKDGWNERAAIKWRCEMLPDGYSRSPRIDNKKTAANTAAYQTENNINYSYDC